MLNAPGEKRFEDMERQLAARPRFGPVITLYGADDGIAGRPPKPNERVQPALVARRVVAGAGHFVPREKPDAVSAAILELLAK
jgi:pimeloyl-ACP methyl ester carboxylesterase